MEKVQIEVIANGMNGEGVARLNGKVVFVEGLIKGETAEVEIVKENSSFISAKPISLIKKSPQRCTPKCPYFFECGGCDLQHMDYDLQTHIKTINVQNLFDKNKISFNIEETGKSENIFAYRNKITMYLNKNNKLCFYKKNSKNLIEINKCLLVSENMNYLIKKLNNFLNINKQFNSFIFKGISIREINNYFIINLILSKKIILTSLQNYLKLNKINYSLYYCLNTNKNSNLPQEPCFFIDGKQEITLNEFNISYPVLPLSFLQVNNEVKYKIYEQILQFVKGQKNVLDAYSGAGLLSAIIAQKCDKVFAIEISPSASIACKELIKKNKIKNMISINGDCAIEVPKLVEKEKLDCVILDPARKGAEAKVLNAILKAQPNSIIYLSCNPATLTRDLNLLLSTNKYIITFAKPYDMFPQTANVETLVRIEKIEQ